MKAARPDTWMPLYWGDYLRDTMHLRTEGHGAYLLLISHYWTTGGPLPDDDDHLSAVTKLEANRWQTLKQTLAKFFTVTDGLWRHGRIDAELERAVSISDARRKAGKNGGKASARTRAKVSTQANTEATPQANTEANTEATTEASEQQNATPSQPQSPIEKKEPPNGGSKENRGTRLPDNWAPSATLRQWCVDEGYSDADVQAELDKFRDYWPAQPGAKGRKADWDATFRNWMRNSGRSKREGGGQLALAASSDDSPEERLAAENRVRAIQGLHPRRIDGSIDWEAPIEDPMPAGLRRSTGAAHA